jgi:hypothetical protein
MMEVDDNSLILERKAMKLWPAMALLLLMWTGFCSTPLGRQKRAVSLAKIPLGN